MYDALPYDILSMRTENLKGNLQNKAFRFQNKFHKRCTSIIDPPIQRKEPIYAFVCFILNLTIHPKRLRTGDLTPYWSRCSPNISIKYSMYRTIPFYRVKLLG